MTPAARRIAIDWADATPIPALRAALADTAADDAAAVLALLRPVLDDARWVEALIARLIEEAARDPLFEPPFHAFDRGVQRGLLLYGDARATIFLGVGLRSALARKRMRPRSGVIVVPGTAALMRVLRSGGGARLSLWAGGWRDGAILPDCRAAGAHRLDDGETLAIDGRTTGFVVEQARADMVLLHATTPAGASPTLCEYDAVTHALSGTGAARDDASRSQLLATLLAELGTCDPDAFAAASRRPEAFARWHAMRLWAANDPDAATPRLAEMARDDPDAELRALAARALALVAAPCPA